MREDATLLTYLRPLQRWLDDPDVKDLHIRQPGVVFVKRASGKTRELVPELDFRLLMTIAEVAATLEGKFLNERSPFLDCSFPGGARVHVKIPPLAPHGTVSMAIRLPRAQNWSLGEIAANGSFARTRLTMRTDREGLAMTDEMKVAAAAGDPLRLLESLVLAGRTIGVTGKVGSGKTTLMNGLLKVVPLDECVITIQDVPEVQLPHQDWSQSLVSFTSAAVTAVTPADALRSALRDDGDRLFVGELRGAEAAMWLQAINTGYGGSIASWHSNEGLDAALQRLADMICDAVPNSDNARIQAQARRYVDVVAHMKRGEAGYECTEICYR